MKKKIFVLPLLLTTLFSVASCSNNEPQNPSSTVESSSSNSKGSSSVSSESSTSSSESGSVSESSSSSASESESSSSSSSSSESTETTSSPSSSSDINQMIASYKSAAINKLDGLFLPVLNSLNNEELKTFITNFYNGEKDSINKINTLEEAKGASNKVDLDVKNFIDNSLKTYVISKVNEVLDPIISALPDENLKTSVQTYKNNQLAKISDINDLSDLNNVYNSIITDTKTFIQTETANVLMSLKNSALETLKTYLDTLVEKIPYDSVKTDIQSFYETEIEKIEDLESIESINPCIEEIKGDLASFALTECKKFAINKLNEAVNEGIEKIPNDTLKADLNEFKDKEIKKINDIEDLNDVKSVLEEVLKETEDYIKELLIATVKTYVKNLTEAETRNAYDYLPEAMAPSYQNNLVNSTDISYDFTNNTNVSSILTQGYGEQWQMVVENINQSVSMSSVFNVAQTVLTDAYNAVNIYIENSYSDNISYNFTGNGYNGVFKYENNKLIFNINVTKSMSVAGIGSVKPIIRMEYDLSANAKGIFISLGDAYKVKYLIRDDAYEMATTYGLTIAGQSASRSSYLSIEEKDNKTTGHIYEYTTYNGSDMIKACADLYIEDDYVSVVGNKASGMTAFDGYINELYKASEGRLLGYEVRETKTIAGVKGTYNTLWFNLWDISGINTIKVCDKTDNNKSGRSTVDVYLNGSNKLLVPAYNSKLTITTSRKFDIELRSRFYYTYEDEKYVAHEVSVPMMFIQEDNNIDTNFSDYPSDMLKKNGIESSVTLDKEILNKILLDYDTYIDVFIENKDKMSSETINAYLEQYE